MLFDTLMNDYKEAMKAKDAIKKDILNFVISQIKYKKIELQKDPEEEDIIQVIKKEIKTRQESLVFIKNAGQHEEAEIETQKIEVLKSYLPEMLSEEKLKEIVNQKIAELWIQDLSKERWKVVWAIMKDYKAVIDGWMLNSIINSMI